MFNPNCIHEISAEDFLAKVDGCWVSLEISTEQELPRSGKKSALSRSMVEKAGFSSCNAMLLDISDAEASGSFADIKAYAAPCSLAQMKTIAKRCGSILAFDPEQTLTLKVFLDDALVTKVFNMQKFLTDSVLSCHETPDGRFVSKLKSATARVLPSGLLPEGAADVRFSDYWSRGETVSDQGVVRQHYAQALELLVAFNAQLSFKLKGQEYQFAGLGGVNDLKAFYERPFPAPPVLRKDKPAKRRRSDVPRPRPANKTNNKAWQRPPKPQS